MTISQINIPKLFLRNFQSMLYFSLLPGSHYEKFVQLFCIAISLKVLDDGLIFSGIARRSENESYTSSFIKHLETAFLKATQPLEYYPMPW